MNADECKSMITEFQAFSREWRWLASWNPRLQILVFYRSVDGRADSASPAIPIRLDRYVHYLQDVQLDLNWFGRIVTWFRYALKKIRERRMKELFRRPSGAFDKGKEFPKLLRQWPTGAASLQDCRLIEPFERLAFFAQQAVFAGKLKQEDVNPIIRWQLLQGSSQPWLHRFHSELSYRSRYDLMNASLREISVARGDERSHVASLDSSDSDTREKYWFTLRHRYELAKEWQCESGRSELEADLAFRESRISYLKVLKEEPYRLELDHFLDQMRKNSHGRTGSESVIAGLLDIDQEKTLNGIRSGASLSSSDSHLLELKFFPWFLERYDLCSARKLLTRALQWQDKLGFWGAIGLTICSAVLFALQCYDVEKIPLPGGHPFQFTSYHAWLCQMIVQVLALFVAAWFSPEYLNIVLPRALFGSLLTWITLVFTSVPGLWAIEGDDAQPCKHVRLSSMVHDGLHDHGNFVYFVALPFFVLALMFVMREIGHWTKNRWIIFKRAGLTTVVLYGGALFWGILFAPPIRRLLTFPREEVRVDSNCLFPIACIGASLAALFALVVELIWDERSIAEPLEEPI